jgi:hypothetical protein
VLHITIVRRNAEETRWLLDFYRDRTHSLPFALFALLTGNARGSFFRSEMMFGGYPLHFAACSNDPDIFDIVLTFSEGIRMDAHYQDEIQRRNIPGLLTIFQLDGAGNNALHLCAKFNLQNMYTHIIKSARGIIGHELRAALLDHCKLSDVIDDMYTTDDAEERLVINRIFSTMDNCTGHPPRESVIMVRNPRPTIHAWLEKDTTHPLLESLITTLLRERLLWVLNKDLQTPLTLAAATIAHKKGAISETELKERIDMLEFLINQHKELRWSYGPITNSMIRLEGIDIPYDYRRFDNIPKSRMKGLRSVIEWLCVADCEQGISLPVIKTIVETKWHRVGKREFMKICNFHILIALLVTLISLYPNEIPTLLYMGSQSSHNRMITVIYPATIAAVIAFMIYGIWRQNPFRLRLMWKSLRGAGAFEVLMRLLYMIAFIVLIGLQVARFVGAKGHPDSMDDVGSDMHLWRVLAICLCVCSSWLYTFYFFMGHHRTAPFLITLYRISSRDIPYFLQFYLILLVSFGTPLAVLTHGNLDTGASSLQHLAHVIWELVHQTVQYNENAYNYLSSSRVDANLDWVYDIVHTGFYFCITITMLNLLIGMITNTYQLYINRGEGLVLLERYNIMSSIFCAYTRADKVRGKYSSKDTEKIVVYSGAIGRNNTRNSRSTAKVAATLGITDTDVIVDVPCYLFQFQENNTEWLSNTQRYFHTFRYCQCALFSI